LACDKLGSESTEAAPSPTAAAPRPLGAAWRGDSSQSFTIDAGFSLEA
jgi:hypothetical protein